MRNPATRITQAFDLCIREMDSMGIPRTLIKPVATLHVIDRAHAKGIQAEIVLVFRLCEVSVQ